MNSKHGVKKLMKNRDDAIFSVVAGKVGSIYMIHIYARFIFNIEIPICIKFNFI